jgi:hypothetical protein
MTFFGIGSSNSGDVPGDAWIGKTPGQTWLDPVKPPVTETLADSDFTEAFECLPELSPRWFSRN